MKLVLKTLNEISSERVRSFAVSSAKLFVLLLCFALILVSLLQVHSAWPVDRETDTTRNSSTELLVRAGETVLVADRRQADESEPTHSFSITTHIERFDFDRETVEISLSVIGYRSWLEKHSKGFPNARLRIFVSGFGQGGFVAERTAAEFLNDTNQDIDFEIPWEVGRASTSFEMNPSSFPLDTLRKSFTLDVRWMQSDGRVFPDNDPPVYVAWGLELTTPNAGWEVDANLSSHPRNELKKRLSLSIERESGRVAQAAVYAVALLLVAIIIASLTLVRMRDTDSEHWEDIGALAALAIAVPTIRSLLPHPAVNVTTLLDTFFLLIFSIIVSALLIRFSSFLK